MINRLPEAYSKTVLLPCYIAEGVVEPFSAAGYELRFYRLTSELYPDESDVDRLLQSISAPPVFILLHYFGRPSSSPRLLSKLRQTGALIVSDCAHAPLSRTVEGLPLGEIGDVALYSLNKLVPVCDGAILSSLTSKVDVALDEEILPQLPDAAIQAYDRHLLACRQLFDEPDPSSATKHLKQIEEGYEEYYRFINGDLTPYRQSNASRDVERSFPYDAVAKIRRKNAIRVERAIYSHEIFKPLWGSLEENVVPFAFPVRVPAAQRDAVQLELFDNGVMASTLFDKWDFVPREAEAHFAIETAFLQEHLLLPVSEFMTDEDVVVLENAIKNIH